MRRHPVPWKGLGGWVGGLEGCRPVAWTPDVLPGVPCVGLK